MIEREEDGGEEGCSICRGEAMSVEFVAMIERASAQPVSGMNFDEMEAWLRSV